MKVIAKKNRELALINAQNTQNENRAETIELVVPEEYENYNKKIVFITSDGTAWDVITDNKYKLTNAITKYEKVDFYIWLTKEVDGESIDFRTKTKTLNFYHNEDASDEITDEEIHGVNTVVNLLEEEIEKVENLNIEATKIGSTTTVTITKKDGTTESVEINDGTDGQDGQDGYTPQKGIDYFTEQDIEEIETDVKNDLEENVLVNYSLIAETGAKIELSINQTNYKLTAILKDKNNNIIHTSNVIDLPLETMVVNATYDNTTKKIILTLQNGTTVEFSVADLVSGLVSESQLQTILANYYTKTEINNLLANKVDKVAGKGLSTNDFTDEYKEQVDTNTEDIEDIQDEQTEQNTDIEKLQEENARLKATLPTTTGEGEDVTLDKTAELEFKKPPLPMGNSEQVQTTQSANLFDENYYNDDSLYTTGTYRYALTRIKGNRTLYVRAVLKDGKTAISGLYVAITTNGDNPNSGTSGYIINNGTNNTRQVDFTGLNNLYFSFYPTNTNLSVIFDTYNIMVSTDNVAYVPFIPNSPSPDYSSPITNVTGDVEVVVSNADSTKSQAFIFPLGNEKLMLGDYLADDGIHHVRGQLVLDGTEKFTTVSVGINSYALNNVIAVNYDINKLQIMSNYFKGIPAINRNTDETVIYVSANNQFIIRNTSFNSITELKTWIAEQYANSTPLIVQYELEEEIIIPYTSAQQEVYNQIKQALSYEEQTNISSNTIALFNVEAYQSTKLVLEEMATAIVALGGV